MIRITNERRAYVVYANIRMSVNPVDNKELQRRVGTELDDYRSPSPEYVHDLVSTGMSSRTPIFEKTIEAIKNDPELTNQEKITMISELLFVPVQKMKEYAQEQASFGIKMNDAVVAVYGATVYPLLRRIGGLAALSEYVNLDNGVILSGGTSWNSDVPAATKGLVDAEVKARASTEPVEQDEEQRRKDAREQELRRAKKYWNSKLVNDRVSDIIDIIPEVFDLLFGRFTLSDSELNQAVLDIVSSREPMTAEDFHEPQIEDLYNYWVIFSSCKKITPELMSKFVRKFCERVDYSLTDIQKEVLISIADNLFKVHSKEELQKKDVREIMQKIVTFCSTDEFRGPHNTYNKLEFYYALYWNESKQNNVDVPPFWPTVANDPAFRKWLAKRILKEKHIEFITENITEAELMSLLHKKTSLHYHTDSDNFQHANIYLETKSTNTRENADESIKILQTIIANNPRIKKFIVISDWQYLLRQVLTTKKALADAIAKHPELEQTLGKVEVMGWPADRICPTIAARYKTEEDLIDACTSELSKIASYKKDVDEMIYHFDISPESQLAKLPIYIGESDKIGDQPGECKRIETYDVESFILRT